MAIPFTFGTQTGIIPLNELDQNFAFLENQVPPLALTAGTVTTANQPNITAVGTLSSVNCTGTVTAGTVTATILNGTLGAAAQPNITAVGALTALSVSGSVIMTSTADNVLKLATDTNDPPGQAAGAMYFNTALGVIRIYDGFNYRTVSTTF